MRLLQAPSLCSTASKALNGIMRYRSPPSLRLPRVYAALPVAMKLPQRALLANGSCHARLAPYSLASWLAKRSKLPFAPIFIYGWKDDSTSTSM
ncbi:hypothetical protein D3C87_1191770 [compost metagenome]